MTECINHNKRCIHCINLKTVLITPQNQILYPFSMVGKVDKQLKKKGKVRIYYCKAGINDKIYTTLIVVDRLYRENCPNYNKPVIYDDAVFLTYDQIYKKRGIYR